MTSGEHHSDGESPDEATWGATYLDSYAAARERKQERLERRRSRRRELSADTLAKQQAAIATAQIRIDALYAVARQEPGFTASPWQYIELRAKAGDPDARCLWRAGREPELARLRCERHTLLQRQVQLRLEVGYISPGGLVGGNPAYPRERFVHAGLVSEEHPLLRLFVASTPRASRLLTGDTKASVDRVGQKLLALDSPYVVTTGAMRRVLRVELDRVFSGGFAELAIAITDCRVPLPNIVVGYLDRAGQLLHPHLIWLLDGAVVCTGRGRRGPAALWRAVLDGLTASLLPIGADPGGRANALRMKNPLSPEWDHAILAEAPYTLSSAPRGVSDLAALAPSLDLKSARARLNTAIGEESPSRPLLADHPDPTVAGQSNALFQRLRILARNRIEWHRDEGNGSEETLRLELLAEALRTVPEGHASEWRAAATATNVARWTWKHYRPRVARAPCTSSEERRARQAVGQSKGAATKRNATLATLVDAAHNLIGAGHRLTQVRLAESTHRCERTIRAYWSAILEAVGSPLGAEPAVQVVIDKKVSSG